MPTGTAYVVGAGLAGLSAAVRLAAAGRRVVVIEGAAQAGGRCRSYLDPLLGITIDNGNHLVLSGNADTMAYLAAIGASGRLSGPAEARFEFVDVRDGRRWTLRPNAGPLPWWVLAPGRRAPGTRAADYLALAALVLPQPAGRRLSEAIPTTGPLWERLIEPLMLAALNEDPAPASAALAAAVARESLMRGGGAYRPRIADPSLEAAFIAPALAFLERSGAEIRLGRRLEAVETAGDRARGLVVGGEPISLSPEDGVVLATPAWVTPLLLPGVTAPDAFNAILNGHFRTRPPPGAPPMVGVIGGTAQWIFGFADRISVTVSGANRLVDEPREALAEALWRDIAQVHGIPGPAPPWQIVKERRATFSATPEQAARRPKAKTALANLVLAGDWIATGLPATIEGAIRSGRTAARLVAGGG